MPSRREALRRVVIAGGALAASGCRRGPRQVRRPGAGASGPGASGPGASGPGASGPRATPHRPFEPAYLALDRRGILGRRAEEAWAIFESCRLCPRRCGVNRSRGETGVCGATAELRLASAGPHFGEEKPLVGRGGSGTVFFSHCNLRCCFCQNWEINHRGDGQLVTKEDLARVMLGLQEKGCHNINLVTPTHVLPNILAGLRLAVRMGLKVPLVYNTGGYDALDAVKLLDGLVDIYLPDFKYQDGAMAGRYSSGAEDYPQVAAAVIGEMHRQVGRLVTDDKGVAERGLIIRHLVMPNNVAGTDKFVRWVSSALGPNTAVNLMDQYWPAHQAAKHPDISRALGQAEYRQALTWARQAGLKNLL